MSGFQNCPSIGSQNHIWAKNSEKFNEMVLVVKSGVHLPVQSRKENCI